MDVFKHQDYREILQCELARRIKQNPRYSQGAFARDLALSPSRLSEILHGKQGVSSSVAQAIAQHLHLGSESAQYFLDLVESQHGRSRLLREAARIRLRRYRRSPLIEAIGEDNFHVITDWYHIAILELLRLNDAQENPQWIAARLGINQDEAETALQRLTLLGLIRPGQAGRSELAENPQNFIGPVQSESFQKYCRQILSKAIEAIDDPRLHAMHSYMIAVAEKNLPQLMTVLRETMDTIAARMEADIGSKDVVYCLTGQFFPVSDLIREQTQRSVLH